MNKFLELKCRDRMLLKFLDLFDKNFQKNILLYFLNAPKFVWGCKNLGSEVALLQGNLEKS